jgi:ubiquinone biosynthesis protein COQ9
MGQIDLHGLTPHLHAVTPQAEGTKTMVAPDINEMTLDELRPILARELPADAAFDGWNVKALEAVAARLELNPAIAKLAFSDGSADMIDAWFASIDEDMLAELPPEALGDMKIRQRITALVEARLALIAPHREALRRAQAILAMPHNVKLALSLGWRAADAMWRAAGDTATDYNHYTKRAILGTVYGATMLFFVNDNSEDWIHTKQFLARRIEGIMQFEKVKAKFTAPNDMNFSVTRLLGRLRYPA